MYNKNTGTIFQYGSFLESANRQESFSREVRGRGVIPVSPVIGGAYIQFDEDTKRHYMSYGTPIIRDFNRVRITLQPYTFNYFASLSVVQNFFNELLIIDDLSTVEQAFRFQRVFIAEFENLDGWRIFFDTDFQMKLEIHTYSTNDDFAIYRRGANVQLKPVIQSRLCDSGSYSQHFFKGEKNSDWSLSNHAKTTIAFEGR